MACSQQAPAALHWTPNGGSPAVIASDPHAAALPGRVRLPSSGMTSPGRCWFRSWFCSTRGQSLISCMFAGSTSTPIGRKRRRTRGLQVHQDSVGVDGQGGEVRSRFVARVIAYIKSCRRLFHLDSSAHRGAPSREQRRQDRSAGADRDGA